MEKPVAFAQPPPMSPTVLEVLGFRFFFYSRESSGGRLEPPHVHVRKGGGEAKVWINSGVVGRTWGFSPRDLRVIRRIVVQERSFLSEAWNEYFREPPSPDGAGHGS